MNYLTAFCIFTHTAGLSQPSDSQQSVYEFEVVFGMTRRIRSAQVAL